MSLRHTLVDFQSFNANLERNAEAVQESAQTEAQKLSPEDAMNQARLVAGFNNAIGKLKEEDKGGGVMSSAENAIGSRIQSALVEAALNNPGLGARIAPATADGLEVKFDNFDVLGWMGTGFRLLFPPKPFPFRDADPDAEAVGDSIRVAMFSDWGSGLYGAPVMSKKIAADPNYQLALHLGDVYYSGSEGEMKSRFSQMYPKPAGAVGRALNGNHEMYSGGTPYIKAVEAELGQKSSCFAWQNTNWLLVGLDTSYKDATTGNEDHSLNDRQVDWLNGLLAKAGSRKVVLFSHHQPYSQLDKQGPKLVAKIEPILKSGRIHSWFWGHEHRCVVYDPHPDWGMKGRCVGHGGFPGFRDTFAGSPGGNSLTWKSLGTKKTDQGAFVAPPAQVLDGPNEFIHDGPPERYSPHGYVTLEFKGDQLREIYHNANGEVIEDPSNL